MEVLFVLLFVVVVVVVMFAIVNQSRTDDSYRRIAGSYSGRHRPGGLFRHPEVHFVHAGAPVKIDIHSTGGEHATYYTQIHFRLPRPSVRCEVYPEGIWSRFGKLLGMEDIQIGSADFDEHYIIKGADGTALRRLLNFPVREQIERLRRFLGNDDIYVSFDQRRLLIKKRSYIRDYDALRKYVELAKGLYDLAVEPPDEGIEFIGDETPPQLTGAVCQVCGDVIDEDVVFCRRCQTPHHRECWHYFGACSTYGCQEKKYLRRTSRRAKRAEKKM